LQTNQFVDVQIDQARLTDIRARVVRPERNL